MSAISIVDIENASSCSHHPPVATMQQWATQAIMHADPYRSKALELHIRIVDETEMAVLNKHYRDRDDSTNVLSFVADCPPYIDPRLLGDVVICAAVVEREASERHIPLTAHWAHMVVHGTLHLLGYDHVADSDAELMESLEVAILKDIGFDNPHAM